MSTEEPPAGCATGPTGPRTPTGKARSSRNAVKSGAFSRRVLQEDKSQVRELLKALKEELRPTTAVEMVVVVDLAINRLRKRRINEWASHQLQKARMDAWNDWRKASESKLTEISVHTSRLSSGRMHPRNCILVLREIRSRIASRGLKPAEDLLAIDQAYGAEKSPIVTEIVSVLEILRCAKNFPQVPHEKDANENSVGSKEHLLDLIDQEIEYQEKLFRFEEERETVQLECLSYNMGPGTTLESVVNIGAILDREFDRGLARLERLRRLRNSVA